MQYCAKVLSNGQATPKAWHYLRKIAQQLYDYLEHGQHEEVLELAHAAKPLAIAYKQQREENRDDLEKMLGVVEAVLARRWWELDLLEQISDVAGRDLGELRNCQRFGRIPLHLKEMPSPQENCLAP
jgi:hypothetical protein